VRLNPLPVLALALLGISVAAPLVRLSHSDPLAIAVWRLIFSFAFIAPLLLATGQHRQLRALSGMDFAIASAAGAMLALHFWSWNASIGFTTIAASVVLVNLQPAFVGVLSALWLREPPSRRQWLGIVIALAGAMVVAAEWFTAPAPPGRNPALGNTLAVLGAVTAALYYIAGRRLRKTLDLWPYVTVVYGACLVTLVAMAMIRGVPLLPLPARELAIMVALAAGPMMLGHTGMNYALRYLPAYAVNLTVLGEPVGATLLAAIIPGIAELPSLWTLAGGLLILFGVFVTVRKAGADP
jgi:drug/metabolite transporter (DMT)-like permease